jgi:serine O-acetyltransferase
LAIKRDIDRYVYETCGSERPGIGAALLVAASPGLWTITCYRIVHHLLYRFQPSMIGKLLAVPAFILSRIVTIIAGIEIESRAHIGCGLLIINYGRITIGAVTMGENCTINTGVTIGRSSTVQGPSLDDLPTIGSRVWLGPGVIVAGPITLGDDVSVAGNSLVTRGIPAHGSAIGVPANVVSREGSFHQVRYRHMDSDPLRMKALDAALHAAVDAAQETEPI